MAVTIWKNRGKMDRAGKRTQTTGDTIIWSGSQTTITIKESRRLSRKITVAHLEWKLINNGLLYASLRFNSRFAKLSNIIAYAPTEQEEVKTPSIACK